MVEPEDFEIPIMVDKVKSVPNWMEFISVSEAEKEHYQTDPNGKINKANLLLYLNARHWAANKSKKPVLLSNKTRNNDSNQNTSTPLSKNYNRIVFFADCMSKGRVCSKILESNADSCKFFGNMIPGQYGVGWLYVMEE